MDPHKILGIQKDATLEEIQRAYREKARKHHPDHGGDTWAFQQVREAYQQLSDGSEVESQSDASRQTNPTSRSVHQRGRGARFWQFAFGKLPLQNETTTFILVNALDIFATYTLMRLGGTEANPVARILLDRWGFDGLIFFKMAVVAFVSVLAQVIACRNLRTARWLLLFGSFVVAMVVAYGTLLIFNELWR